MAAVRRAGTGWLRRRRSVLLAALSVVLVLAGALTGDVLWAVQRVHHVEAGLTGTTGGTTFLLLGSDSRAAPLPPGAAARYLHDRRTVSGARADVVVLLRVPDRGRPHLLVVPRDLLVSRADGLPRRLTTALQEGPGEVAASLCREGVGVDHVVVVDFAGVVALVDAVGGVDLTTDAPLRDLRSGLALPRAGRQHVDGLQALAWVRSRHPERRVGGTWTPATDLQDGRPRRLLDVLSQVAARVGSSPWRALAALHAVTPSTTADQAFGVAASVDLGRALRATAGQGRADVLPVRLRDGAVPVAFPTDGTAAALHSVQGPSACATAREHDGPTLPGTGAPTPSG